MKRRTLSATSKTLRFLLAGLISLTLLGVVAVFIGYRSVFQKPGKAISILNQRKATISLAEIQHTATRDGKKEWTLTAKSAHFVSEKKKTYIQSPYVVFFLDDGGEVFLSAREGVINTDSNDITASGDVEIKHKDYVLNAQKLYYIHESRLIFSKLPVEIRGARFHLTADRMSYDLKTNKSVLDGNVKGTLNEKMQL
ncbi:MAG: LPS export ABC transporter periplasmic protein LptC [Deltaproteobacteria bacterium RBG_13_49_15]|jgi:LPS export ABC transporter protein LptC|nr:MAG: LPS export ABC transporter periplasmic protein LptC [Deltaproteobacteria bacterium RBG_13_49_15]